MAREKNARKRLVFDNNPRIGLVVLEQNVVSWFVFLYEVVFKKQRILFGFHNKMFDGNYFAYQHFRFGMRLLFVEVRRNTAFQVFCLTHIDKRSLFIKILIHAGIGGQRGKLLSN